MTRSLTQATAARLRAVMSELDVTGRELARLLNEQAMWVTRRRRGTVSMTFDDVERIAAALQVPVAELCQPATKLTEVA
jgi:transcriptional regulator with XRE-family HTH domain